MLEIDRLERRAESPAEGPQDRPEALLTSAFAISSRAYQREDATTMRRCLAVVRKITEREAIVAAAGPAPTVSTEVVHRGYKEVVISPDPPRVLSGEPRCQVCRLSYLDSDGRRPLVKVRASGGSVLSACARCIERNRLVPA
jgi:hypothetical protein